MWEKIKHWFTMGKSLYETLYNWYTKTFKKEKIVENACCELAIVFSREDLFKMLDLNKYQDVVYMNDFDEDRPTILIMDDIIDTYDLYKVDFSKMKHKYKLDVYEKYNVVAALGSSAGFIAYKFIISGRRLDYAILDITIGSIVKFPNGEFLDVDGIDIAISIDKYSTAKSLFSTAHTLNRKNLVMEYYISKYEEYSGMEINEQSISKNANRVEPIYNFITS